MTPSVPNTMNVVWQSLREEDLPALASIHMRAFPESALTLLGKEAVRRYYEWLLTGPHDAATFGVFSNGSLAGYSFAGKYRGALTGFLRKNRLYLIRCVLCRPWLIVKPRISDQIAMARRLLKRRDGARQGSSEKQDKQEPVFGILAMAVDPDHQGSGIGTYMFASIESYAKERGFRRMRFSVRCDNHQALRLYEYLGWERIPVNGTWSGRMEKAIL